MRPDRHPGQHAKPSAAIDPEWEVAPTDLHDLRRAGTPHLLVDCRTPPERDAARIDGDVFAPMDDLATHLETLRAAANGPVIVYCRSGRRSLAVAAALRRVGFDGARSLAGGIMRWSREITPTES